MIIGGAIGRPRERRADDTRARPPHSCRRDLERLRALERASKRACARQRCIARVRSVAAIRLADDVSAG